MANFVLNFKELVQGIVSLLMDVLAFIICFFSSFFPYCNLIELNNEIEQAFLLQESSKSVE